MSNINTKIFMIAVIASAFVISTVAVGTSVFAQNDTMTMSGSDMTMGNMTGGNMTSGNMTDATTVKAVDPSKSIEKEFWINTVHIDGKTNLNATSTHPAEKPPANSTIPTGGGFKITEPNNVGDWEFRSFTFAPGQIVVNQGDKVTLHFIGVQGPNHVIEVKGVDTFELKRGQIHTVSFTPNSPGTITYICNVHPPNMVGQISVLPKATV